MWFRPVVIAVLCSACGKVNNPAADAQIADAQLADAPPIDGPVARTYHTTVLASMAVPFGGAPGCSYTVTLRQTDIQLAILPSRQVTGGEVQALYDEKLTSTCSQPAANPVIFHYTFASATASGSGMTLTFQEKAGDKPGASLVIELTAAAANYMAQLTFKRTDLGGSLAWTVMIPATLTPQ